MLTTDRSDLFQTICIVVTEYILIFLATICRSRISQHRQSQIDGSSQDFASKVTSKCTYESHCPPLNYLLFTTRCLSLGYILGISVIAEDILTKSGGLLYFTNWNTRLISLYFFLASICSVVGLIATLRSEVPVRSNDTDFTVGREGMSIMKRDVTPEQHESTLSAVILRGLFEVCGGTSLLITVVAFGLLDPEFEFWNVSSHFVTMVSLVLELGLNSMFVRLDHYIFNITWALFYLIFVWIIVSCDLVEWPYFFLDTSSPYRNYAYSGLLVANFSFYLIWYGLSEMKRALKGSCCGMCYGENSSVTAQSRLSYIAVDNVL